MLCCALSLDTSRLVKMYICMHVIPATSLSQQPGYFNVGFSWAGLGFGRVLARPSWINIYRSARVAAY